MRRLIGEAAASLAAAGIEDPRLDAELLMAEAAGVTRAAVLAGLATVDDHARVRYAAMIRRRAAREPVAYIVGHKEFYSIELEVNRAVLIPRPETETVVAAALELIAGRANCRVLDLATGSGAIAIAIVAHAPGARVIATDVSAAALETAGRNAIRFGLAPRIELRRADCFEPMDGGPQLLRFDLIVSNPPYISEADLAGLQPEVIRYEPRIALAGGVDGLDFYRRIAREADRYLAPGGALMVEIGAGQAAAVAALMRAAGFSEVGTIEDLAGVTRVVRAS